jgi:hypothetical protein
MAKRKGKEENLHPFGTRAEDVERAVRSKGGYARAEKIREEKTIRSLLQAINDEEVEVCINGNMVKAVRKLKPILALQVKAEEGDVIAIREWAKLQGEYEDKVKLDADVSSEAKVLLSLGDIEPDDLAKFITDAQTR